MKHGFFSFLLIDCPIPMKKKILFPKLVAGREDLDASLVNGEKLFARSRGVPGRKSIEHHKLCTFQLELNLHIKKCEFGFRLISKIIFSLHEGWVEKVGMNEEKINLGGTWEDGGLRCHGTKGVRIAEPHAHCVRVSNNFLLKGTPNVAVH
jgi:hypothetical protein